MAGIDNRGAVMEDWMLPTTSPRTFMTSLLNDDFSSGNNKPQDGIKNSKSFADLSQEGTAQVTKAPLQFESTLFGVNEKSSSNGSLEERMAARNGFCALKIDTSRVGFSASIRSPITIPPGVSPRELLKSPFFLPNAIAQPSPTTGKLLFLRHTNVNPTLPSVPKKAEHVLRDDSAFSFQAIWRSKPPSLSIADKDSSAIQQSQPSANGNQLELSLQSSSTAAKDVSEATSVKPKTSDSMFHNDCPIPANEQEESETTLDTLDT